MCVRLSVWKYERALASVCVCVCVWMGVVYDVCVCVCVCVCVLASFWKFLKIPAEYIRLLFVWLNDDASDPSGLSRVTVCVCLGVYVFVRVCVCIMWVWVCVCDRNKTNESSPTAHVSSMRKYIYSSKHARTHTQKRKLSDCEIIHERLTAYSLWEIDPRKQLPFFGL